MDQKSTHALLITIPLITFLIRFRRMLKRQKKKAVKGSQTLFIIVHVLLPGYRMSKSLVAEIEAKLGTVTFVITP